MMTATSAQEIMSEGSCFLCYGPMSSEMLLRLVLLRRIATRTSPMTATDPQSLIDYAKCFGCFSSASSPQMMELALLDIISQSVGSGTGSQIVYYEADPNAESLTPNNPNSNAMATKEDGTGPIYTWNITLQTWN